MTAQQIVSRYPDLPGFAKENRELVYAMTEAGWTGRMTSKGHYLAKAPDGTSQITVPAKNGNNRGLKNAHAAFLRWVKAHMPAELRELWDTAKAETDPLLQDVLAEGLVRKQTEQVMAEQADRDITAAIEGMREMLNSNGPVIKPWLARKHSGKEGGTRYESQTTLERVWPTGETDYLCMFEGCDYSHENPRSVAMHYGQQHTRKGESEGAGEGPLHLDPAYTEPVSSRYRPTERLVAALMDVITGLEGLSADEMAVRILTWMHERPDIDHEPRSLVPLTDAQIIDRIRMLVGQPDQTPLIEELKQQRDEANAHLVKVQRDLDGIKELMEGVGR